MIIHQPQNGTLGNTLINILLTGKYSRLNIICAYAKLSGVSRLEDAFNHFRKNGGEINLFIGIDQKNTTYEALLSLLSLSNNLYIIHNENISCTFHHKVYLLDKHESDNDSIKNMWLAVGSNNLTAGGLFINYESCIISECSTLMPENRQMYTDTLDLFTRYSDPNLDIVKHITTINMIQELYDNNYICKEKETRISLIKQNSKNNSTTSKKLFGSQKSIAPPSKHYDTFLAQTTHEEIINDYISNTNIQEMFWFEMRKSTGGSRNILDLSSTGKLVAGQVPSPYNIGNGSLIHGGVKFFELDPSDTTKEKDITISYKNNEYFPSTIKFAPDNGSWRIQLKGDSSTDSLSLSEYGKSDFVNNILVFQKISPNYYILEVLSSSELPSLMSSSIFYATNGISSTSKMYGKLK